VSIRRACAVLGGGRSTYHYAARRPPQAVLSKRIREIAETRIRYGYRRIHVLLRREGWPANVKRIYRLYPEEGLQLPHKTPKPRVAAKLREDRSPPAAPKQVWAMDFLSDQLFDGRKIRILTIVDAYSRRSTPGRTTAARRSSRRWSGSPGSTARRRRFVSTMGRSSSARRSISGPGSTG